MLAAHLKYLGLSLLASTCLMSPAIAQTNFYVDPSVGSDQATGTSQDQPFRTLARAQQAVRAIAGQMTDDVIVNLRGGTYVLTAPLTLGPADSGRNGHTVAWMAYAGETPVVTSGRQITGWRAIGNGQYRAPVGRLNFRQMFVNGVRATRARYPEVGSWGQLSNFDQAGKTLTASPALSASLNNLRQVEMNLLLQWGENYLRVAGVSQSSDGSAISVQDAEAGIIFQRPNPVLAYGSPLYYENALEFISNPGEFYVSTSEGYVYYMPRPGEAMSSASVLAPTLQTLVDLRGDSLDAPAHDIRISGVTFADTTWMYATNNGELNAQGGLYNLTANLRNEQTAGRPPAAVHAAMADRIQFDGNTFTRAGATALDLDHGVHDSAVVGNLVYDISGNGIMLGKFSDPGVEYHSLYNPPSAPAGEDVREVTRNVNVLNNLVTRVGQDYYGTAGINGGFVNGVVIRNNDVSGSPWAGITLGWGWQHQPNALGNNHVDRNAISNAMTILCDSGGFYHLSNDRGTTVNYNYVHDVYRVSSACGSAVASLYLDEGSDNLSLSNNVVQDADPTYFFNNNGPNNVVQNNGTQGSATIQAAGLENGYQSLRNRINLAFNRTATASSSFSPQFGPAAANDGQGATGWSASASDGAAWWQVDLGKPYQLSQFSVVTRQDVDQSVTRTNFEVQGSNDPAFAAYTVLGRNDKTTTTPFAATVTRQITSRDAYRYVRIAKTDGSYFFIGDVSVFGGGGEIVSYPVPSFDPGRFYKIRSVRSGKVLGVANASTQPIAGLDQEDDTGVTSQQFAIVRKSGNLFQIVARHSGMSVDVNGASRRRGASAIQYPFANTSNQLWYFQPGPNGSWVIRNVLSDQVLDVSNGSSAAGAGIDQWTYNGGDNQQWTIE